MVEDCSCRGYKVDTQVPILHTPVYSIRSELLDLKGIEFGEGIALEWA